jgi:hypothetical protein
VTKLERACVFAVMTSIVALSTMSLAQTKPKPKPPAVAAKKPAVKPDAGPAPMTPDAERDAATPLHTPPTSAAATPPDAGALEVKTLDGGARVFRFGEMEIEGRLKSPQLVYFLRRVRAEFAAGDLGHRTFMKEMSDTRNDPSF